MRLSADGSRYEDEEGVGYVRMTHAMGVEKQPWLEKWRVKYDQEHGEGEAEAYALRTADIGNLVHKVCELYDKGRICREVGYKVGEKAYKRAVDGLCQINPWLLPYLMYWITWSEKRIERWLWVERVAWCERWRVAGTIDRLGVMMGDDKAILVDIKSTGTVHDDVGIQLTGYREMIVEEVERRGLHEAMIPSRALVVHMPGPREDKEVIANIKIKEVKWTKYKERFERRMEKYWREKGKIELG